MEESQNLQISSDPGTRGFDLSAGKTWIYPENYPVRDYQFNIVQACLYSNTLVCLPTGLGKTFIAAVIMYNFWRWYPCGKVVFLAPTKPLVAQQIYACYDVMGIPSTETIELTGAVNQKQRELAWIKKRVIFGTPQIFRNDLEKNIVPSDLVKCVVIDEAHKALGNHSYCECIRILREKNQNFRVLALSATPGNNIDSVHEVLQNLCVAHVELKDETSSDIIPYINQRKIDIILVPLNKKLTEYKEKYIFIMDRHVKVLLQYNVLNGQTANISKGRVFYLLKEFQRKPNKSGNYGKIMKALNILMTMYHAYELMVRDGIRAFHKFYQNHSDKFWMNEETQLQELLEDIQAYLGPFPDVKNLNNELIMDIPENLVFGHTKFQKLKQLLEHHFKKDRDERSDTRAIVFVEYRDIVSEIYVLLLQCRPLIRPQMFVGQAGQKQRQQIKALDDFRNNRVNVLISTSIGEEGLDVGEVDLIICFDISQQSPTRLVQRMGRTGRKRDGHITILVADAREHETLKSTIAKRDFLNNKVLNMSNISSSLYQNNPRMIPDTITPECLKMHINVQPRSKTTKGTDKNKKSPTKMCKRKNTLKKSTNTESHGESQKDGTKFLMTTFLKSRKRETPNVKQIENSDVRQTIKSFDVKVLSSDSDALDFLTMCALRNSQRETCTEENENINKCYLPEFSTIKGFFNFSIPHLEILDGLVTLNDIRRNCKRNYIVENNISDGNDSCNDNNGSEHVNSTNEMAHNVYATGESKFEDLLDDSSKSDESDVLNTKVEKEENKNDNVRSVCVFSSPSEQYAVGSDIPKVIINDTDVSQDFDSGRFEDILNETSDEFECNVETVKGVAGTLGKYIDARNSEDVQKSGRNLKVEDIELHSTDLHEAVKIDSSIILDIRSERTVKNYEQRNEGDVSSNVCKGTKGRTMLSVTQAVEEIARINSYPNTQRVIVESEDDMFQDESFADIIDNKTKFDRKIECSMETRVSTAAGKLCDDAKNTIVEEFKVEEYEWDDDFGVCVDSRQDRITLNTPEEKKNGLKEVECNVETCISDNEDWISVKKSFNLSKRNTSSISIVKKVASIKKCLNSKREHLNRLTGDTASVGNRSFCNEDRIVGSKTSYFLNESEENVGKGIDCLKVPCIKNSNRARRSKKVRNKFIDDEAKVSSISETTATDESSGTDEDLVDFVSYTQNVHDTSDMHAHYLQTIRSPVKRHDGFHLKRPRDRNTSIEIYSQPVTQVNETYINDSFCVAEDEEGDEESGTNESLTRSEDLSELEMAERELIKKKRKRARGEELEDNAIKRRKRNKRRNRINYSSSSSEDELAKLREQIKHE
ncbi:PREDICTED: Fanconi anemia group M protein [Dufourea novaeangliae]|uniref:Fanconi anemia group M protein like protein n=1 Tax=Dufourea novaeangliae TaxID=178035 RepID=A0A154PNW6_DUFNO|nr:PREDICTED: Fanconi anemia group M protein [Dufourea novaeangliae]KZC12910.1 Fanconi anemia group M protein like protein [Dufourea novaeangliae]